MNSNQSIYNYTRNKIIQATRFSVGY